MWRIAISLDELVSQFSSRKLPPVGSWNPSTQRSIDMHIDRSGRWFYQGSEIQRDRMVALFSTVLDFDGARYSLVTPGERLWITVEDAPFVALLLDGRGQGEQTALRFTDNVGNQFTAGEAHPIQVELDASDNPRPYVTVRGRLRALIARSVYYQLAEYACLHEGSTGVWSDGCFFALEQEP